MHYGCEPLAQYALRPADDDGGDGYCCQGDVGLTVIACCDASRDIEFVEHVYDLIALFIFASEIGYRVSGKSTPWVSGVVGVG